MSITRMSRRTIRKYLERSHIEQIQGQILIRAFCTNLQQNKNKDFGANFNANVDEQVLSRMMRAHEARTKINIDTKISGNVVVGIPKESPHAQQAKAKRFIKLTSHGESSFSVGKVASQAVGLFKSLDNLLGSIYKGTFKALITLIFHPMKAMQAIKSGWETVKHEGKYYWAGFRLFGLEFRTSARLATKSLTGYPLSRRERKQLVRTSADVLRLIPFSFFIIVPFMEFVLPIALRIFPGMLPSTFQDEFKQEENMKKQLKLRIDIAEFLQDMVIDMGQQKALKSKGKSGNPDEPELTIQDLERFIREIRLGKPLPSDLLFKISKLFSDDLTIENMSRSELVLLCRYMEIPAYGGNNFLRMQLRQKINNLRRDDRTIFFEGVDSLNLLELKQACQERGMRATGISRDQLKKQLKQWVDLSVNKNVPTSLLILSRAFIINDFQDESKYPEALKEAIGQIDNNMAMIALAENLSSVEGVTTDSATLTERKLEAIRIQNQLIEAEKVLKPADKAKVEKSKAELEKLDELLTTGEEMKDPAAIEAAFEKLEELTLDSAVEKESRAFQEVLAKQEDFLAQVAMSEGKILDKASGTNVEGKSSSGGAKEDKTQTRMQQRLTKMLKKLEKDIGKAGESIGDKLRLLDMDRDGKISRDELKYALENGFKEKFTEDDINFIVKKLDLDNDGTVTMDDLQKVANFFAEKKKKEE